MQAIDVTNSLVGSLLGKDYQVLEQIGRGGMAVVYLVEHQTLQKRFAAKVLTAEHATNEEARARFAQEAHAASQLDHENIVTISDFGRTLDDRPFYVMELLRGRTLMDRLEEGPMTIEEVVAVSVPVARALAHAHAEGVIHRDVKPENVFLVQRSQGRWGVKVLDFGIAKVATNPALTKMGQALGSPMFMAPEACRGDDVDQRADLYSFGTLLFLMLTGRVPFHDPSLLKILQMQVSSPVPSLREFKPDVSPELEAVVMRSLAKDPDERYPTMEAMLFDLQLALPEGSDMLLMQAQFGTAVHDTPFPSQSLRMHAVSSQRLMIGDKDASTHLAALASAKFPSAPPKRRSRWLVAVGTVAVLAALAGGGIYAWERFGMEPEPPVIAADNTAPAAPAKPEVVAPPSEPIAAPPPAPTPPPVEPEPEPAIPEPAPVTPTVAAIPAPPKNPVVRKLPPARPPKRGAPVLAAAVSPEPNPEPTPKPGSAAPDPKPAVAVTPVVPPEPPRVVPPAGSAAPPVVTPQPPRPAVVQPVDVGSLDATPTIASLDVNGPLPSSVVRRGLERVLPALRSCYRTAAKAAGKTPTVNLSLSFEVDENSVATNISAARGASLGTLQSCVRSAISTLQTQQAPDVGTVQVVVAITFRPT